MAIPFSSISQDPMIRAIVQDGVLERAFHDALFPRLLFRGEAEPIVFPGNVGDTLLFTGVGLIPPKQAPLKPGNDPTPSKWPAEQWSATTKQYADTIDTPMPTSIQAIADLFLRNAHQLGMSAGLALNNIVRNRLFNAGEVGNTVADGAYGPGTALRVLSINGFTTARRPDLAAGSPVKFDYVSTNNPLKITVNGVANTVTGFASDFGDETGPGVLTLGSAVTVVGREAVLSLDRAVVTRVGGGTRTDDVGSTNLLTLAAIRTAVARLRSMNVPEMPDKRFHVHLDPTSESQIFSDAEFQRLLTALPDHYTYREFAVGELQGCVFFRNTLNPLPETILAGAVNPVTGGTAAYNPDEGFAGEVYSNSNSSTGVRVHRVLFVGQGAVKEYYQDLGPLVTEAGVTGKVGSFQITNNSIEIMTERIQCIVRAPLDRLQEMVATSWRFIGDWPTRTDVTTGDAARIKRVLSLQHGE